MRFKNGFKYIMMICIMMTMLFAFTGAAYARDNTRPHVALSYSANPAKIGTMTITATYTENVCVYGVLKPLITINQPGSTDIYYKEMTKGANNKIWTYTYTVRQDNGSTYKDGTATVSLTTVFDAAGNPSYNPTSTTFTIDTKAPKITISPYNTNPTNQNVTVTATTNEGTLNFASHIFTQNGSFTFTATDAAGNVTNKTVTVTNIDKTAPVDATFTASPTAVTKGSVTVIINFPTDAAVKQYKVGTGSYENYTAPVVVTENTTVYAKSKDAAGNWSNETSFAVTNIDNIPPDLTLPGDVTIEAAYDKAVTLYEHINYEGYSVNLGVGSYTLSQLQAKGMENDKISSLKVKSGYKVILYEHDNYGGRDLTRTSDDNNFCNSSFNDKLSSLRVVVDIGTASATDQFDVTIEKDKPDDFDYPLGVTKVTWTAADANGNVSTGTQRVTLVDTTPPDAPVLSTLAQVINADTIIIEGTAEAGSTITISGGVSTVTGAADETGSFSIEVSLKQDDINTLSITAADAAGNISNPTTVAITEDSTAPAVTLSYSANPAKAGPLTITAAYGEPVRDGDMPKISINQPGRSDIVSQDMTPNSDRSTWTYTYMVNTADGTSFKDGKVKVTISTVSDRAGNTSQEPSDNEFVIDTKNPVVRFITADTANGAYNAGDVIKIKVKFTEKVYVTGTPKLWLETGENDRYAQYVSGDGTDTLKFQYEVQPGDTAFDLDYVSSSSLEGTIRDAARNDAVLTLPQPGEENSLGKNKDIVIDTTAPTYTLTFSKSHAKAGDSVTITAAFSEGIKNNETPKITIDQKGTADARNQAMTPVGEDRKVWQYTFGVNAPNGRQFIDGTATVTISTVHDTAGNEAVLEGENTFEIDNAAPTVTLTHDHGSLFVKKGDKVTITATFNEKMAEKPVISINVAGTASSTDMEGANETWTYTWKVPGQINGSAVVTVAGIDLAGNVYDGTDSITFTIDNAPPSAPDAPVLKDSAFEIINADEETAGFNVIVNPGTSGACDGDTLELLLNGRPFPTPLTHVLNAEEAAAGYSFNIAAGQLGRDGDKAVTARVVDASGNAGPTSQPLNLILDKSAPKFSIQYYSDEELTISLGDSPALKAGIYYLKITSNEALREASAESVSVQLVEEEEPVSALTISLDAEGTANDVTDAAVRAVGGNDYVYIRTIAYDAEATGKVRENISITGTDEAGNTAENRDPDNEKKKAAYTDTIAPVVTGIENGGIYNAGRRITFNEGTAKLNGVDFVSKTTVTEAGDHVLVVTDKAGNSTTVDFTIIGLSFLAVSRGELTPVFNSNTTGYYVSVSYGVSSISVTYDVNTANTTIKVNGSDTVSGTVYGPIELVKGNNEILISLLGRDGVTTRNYTITVHRNEASNDAELVDLTVSAGILSPLFNPEGAHPEYTLEVPFSVSETTVTPVASNPYATIEVNGFEVESGTPSIPINLTVGRTIIYVYVIAQDGMTANSYMIVVTRGEPEEDATLSGLTVSAGDLVPVFSPMTTEYSLTVANSVYETTVTPVANGQFALISVINGESSQDVGSGEESDPITLNVGSNVITVVVTPQEGETKTYTITITRLEEERVSSDATLSGLVLSSGTLNPDFESSNEQYRVRARYNTRNITVTPTAAEENSTITVNGIPVANGTESQVINLVVGNNIIEIKVTAPNGTTFKTYEVDVQRLRRSSSSYAPPVIITPAPAAMEAEPAIVTFTEGSTAVVGLNATTQGDTVVLSDALVNSIIARITELVKQVQETPATCVAPVESRLMITVEGTEGAAQSSVSIPMNLINEAKTNNIANIDVTSQVASMLIPVNALEDAAALTMNVEAKVVDNQTLAEEQKAAAGDNPVYEFNIIAARSGVAQAVTLNSNVRFTVPYALKEGEEASKVTAYFMNDKGELENAKGTYDAQTSTVSFKANCLGKYVLKSKNVAFEDLDNYSWAKPHIESLAAKEVVKGKADGKYVPGNNVTRAEFASMLVKAFDVPEAGENAAQFGDVSADAWYAETVKAAAQAGLVTGYSDGTFKPDAKVSRQDMAVMAARVIAINRGYCAIEDIEQFLDFTDRNEISDYAKDSVAKVVELGVMKGNPDKTFKPQNSVTRAEAAVVIHNLFNLK